MNIKLKKPWKNHPKGAILTSVSKGILAELIKLMAPEPEMKQTGRQIELKYQLGWIPLVYERTEKIGECFEKYLQLSSMVSLMNISRGSQVLDVGCGISSVLVYIDCLKTGLDILADAYQEAFTYPDDMIIKNGPAEDMPIMDRTMDAVFCTNALDHTESPDKVASEIYRVLSPGGHCLISCEIFKENIIRNAAHPHSFKAGDVEEIMEKRLKKILTFQSDWTGLKNYVTGRPPVGIAEVSVWRKAC